MTLRAVPPTKRPRRARRRLSAEYIEYIRSPAWRKRSKLYRATHPMCERLGCNRPAAQVHHLKYGPFDGQEPDAWLQSVCKECHGRLHPGRF